MTPPLAFLIALLVFVVAVALAAVGTIPVVVGGLVGALALAMLAGAWGWWRPRV